jgi:hypothetical protein
MRWDSECWRNLRADPWPEINSIEVLAEDISAELALVMKTTLEQSFE